MICCAHSWNSVTVMHGDWETSIRGPLSTYAEGLEQCESKPWKSNSFYVLGSTGQGRVTLKSKFPFGWTGRKSTLGSWGCVLTMICGILPAPATPRLQYIETLGASVCVCVFCSGLAMACKAFLCIIWVSQSVSHFLSFAFWQARIQATEACAGAATGSYILFLVINTR